MPNLLSPSDGSLRDLLRQVATLDDLAGLLEVSRNQLTHYSYGSGRQYRVFHIRKRRGGVRVIHEPASGLKLLQSKLLQVFSAAYDPLASVHGFARGRSIVTNAVSHAGRTWILNLDLEDFFPSIHFGRVRGVLLKRPFSWPNSVASAVAHIATWNGSLPQGAPTSPILANLVARSLDLSIGSTARRLGCAYTRYADDLTLSTSAPVFPAALATLDGATGESTVGTVLADLVAAAGFRINNAKVRLVRSNRRQEVTGLVVNEFPNLTRRRLKRVRAMLHAWRRYGHDDAEAHYFERYDRNKDRGPHSAPRFRSVVKGHIDFIGMVRGWDSRPYRRLLAEYAALTPGFTPRPATRLGPLHNPRWSDGIWVLESNDEDDPIQGTAFELEGFGLVTCAHVLFRQTQTGWTPRSRVVAFHPERPSAVFPVSAVAWDHDTDLAVARFDGSRGWRFQPSLAAVRLTAPIVLAGYPHFSDGAGLLEQSGHVVHQRSHFGHPRLVLSCRVIEGASGSPVLDHRGRVIGVATVGAPTFQESEDEPMSGAVPIGLLTLLA